MRYLGQKETGFHWVEHNSKRYLLRLVSNLSRGETWADSLMAQIRRGEEYVVFEDDRTAEKTVWPEVKDRKLREQIILCAWPRGLE